MSGNKISVVMKNIYSIIFMSALMLSSCVQEEISDNSPYCEGREFTASFEQAGTRTYVEDGVLLRWTSGDQISLFDGNTLNRQYRFDGETGDNSGTFSIVDAPYGSGRSEEFSRNSETVGGGQLKYKGKEMRPDWIYRRGDIYLANLNPFKGSEQGGTRPVLVLQNNDGNYYCPTLIVAPITTKLKKLNMPTHCYFEKVRGLAEPSMVSLEQIKTIDKCRIEKYLGKMTREQMTKVEDAIRESLGMEIPECVEAP